MTPQEWKDATAGIQSVVTALAILGGGVWALARFWREREGAPRIQFDTTARFVGRKDEQWLVELLATLENRGKIRQRIEKFTFRVTCATTTDEMVGVSVVPFQHECASGSWISKDWSYTFVEPGVKQSYSVVVMVPASSGFLHIGARFDYTGTNEFHEADWTGKVPQLKTVNMSDCATGRAEPAVGPQRSI
jgi:hypothetical protein